LRRHRVRDRERGGGVPLHPGGPWQETNGPLRRHLPLSPRTGLARKQDKQLLPGIPAHLGTHDAAWSAKEGTAAETPDDALSQIHRDDQGQGGICQKGRIKSLTTTIMTSPIEQKNVLPPVAMTTIFSNRGSPNIEIS